MEISATTSTTSVTSQATSLSQNSKTSEDKSFKSEMDKASNTDKTETKKTEKNEDKVKETKAKDDKKVQKNEKQESDNVNAQTESKTKEDLSFNAINNMLSNDIQRMMNSTNFNNGIYEDGIMLFGALRFGESGSEMKISMNEDDSNFFINLANKDSVNMSAIGQQAQDMIDNGFNMNQVQQSAKISQTLIDALNTAREKNQPVRIDFDKDISVILRVNQQGQISANFIPGDKAVEQYLRQNISLLKERFDESNLPYTDLSYSNSSKEQARKRRNEQQQGE